MWKRDELKLHPYHSVGEIHENNRLAKHSEQTKRKKVYLTRNLSRRRTVFFAPSKDVFEKPSVVRYCEDTTRYRKARTSRAVSRVLFSARKFPLDLDIFSPSTFTKALCTQQPQKGFPWQTGMHVTGGDERANAGSEKTRV